MCIRDRFTLAGIWAANRLEVSWGEDPSRVVVDEMVGVNTKINATVSHKRQTLETR